MATISNLGVGMPGLSDLYDKLQAAEETKLTAIAKQKPPTTRRLPVTANYKAP